jgi:hypothetical protein
MSVLGFRAIYYSLRGFIIKGFTIADEACACCNLTKLPTSRISSLEGANHCYSHCRSAEFAVRCIHTGGNTAL